MQIFSSCDPGWFMVDGMCINFYLCPDCKNNIEAQEQCSMFGGQLAYHCTQECDSQHTQKRTGQKQQNCHYFGICFIIWRT